MKSHLFVAPLAFASACVAVAAEWTGKLDAPEWPDVTPQCWNPAGGVKDGVPSPEAPKFDHPPRAEMRMVDGNPEVFIDGKMFPVLWGAVQRRRRPDGLPRHSAMPLTVMTVNNVYIEWHPRLGVYDFSVLDRLAEQYITANPNVYFLWDLSVYPPDDFAQKFPGEMACDDLGDRTSIGRFSWSFASRRGMEEIKEMVEKAIRHIEASPYANRVIGYRVNSGVTIEWLGWDAKPGRVKDFSSPNKAAFAAFAALKYPELKNPHVPTLEERAALDAENDILWDRKKHLNAIAYMDYNSWIIVQDALEACGHAKDVLASLGRTKLVGTYYGYTFFLNASGNDQRRGHYTLQEMLEKNDGRIDFIMSPQSYHQRRLGDTFGEMKPFATMAAWGVKPVIEDDTRTHNRLSVTNWYGFRQVVNAAQTEAIVRRNMSIALCRCTSPYQYSLTAGLEMDSPECVQAARDILPVLKRCMADKVRRHAEVALVASEQSILSTPTKYFRTATGRWLQEYCADGKVERLEEKSCAFSGEVFTTLHTEFARTGTPVDFLLAEDLKNHPGNYKLYVFLNQFTYDEALRMAVERLRARGATILWLYAPGWSKGNSLADMKALTGIEFGKMEGPTLAGVTMKDDGRYMGTPDFRVAQAFYPVDPDVALGTYADGRPGVAMKKVGGSRNYFSGVWQLDMPFIRKVVRDSGAHIYCDSDDPVEANDALFTLHARFPGRKTVRLPRKVPVVVDVFGKRVVARDTDEFSFDAPLHSSHLFYFGIDTER